MSDTMEALLESIDSRVDSIQDSVSYLDIHLSEIVDLLKKIARELSDIKRNTR